MISHKYRFIFIHIPKTAGTSIEKVLYDESCQLLSYEWDHDRVPHTPLNHLTLQELVDYGILTPAQLKSYFKFCFVRNPWDRLISEIFCPWMSPYFKDLTVEQRIRRACEWATTRKGLANHLRLQQDFITADGLQMDFIGRFERLKEDFGQICRWLGVNVTLPHLNQSPHRSYQEYYDEATQALTAVTYRSDIDAFHYKFEETAGDYVVGATPRRVDQSAKKKSAQRKMTAYPLVEQPALLQPAARETEGTHHWDAAQQGWQVCCPVAFAATWNGGPNAEDIEIRLAAEATTQPAFVQSNLGMGLLTFYSGYQWKTDDEFVLWVRGPINASKDGLSPLESIVDTSLLPCTIAIQWQFTRAHHTIHFAAGEPFATLLLYAKTGLPAAPVEVVDVEKDEDSYRQVFQQTIAASALQSLFQRLCAQPIEPVKPVPKPQMVSVPADTVSSASEPALVDLAYLIVAHHQPNHLARLIRAMDQENSYFFIHIDQKTEIEPFRAVLPQRDNIIFMPDRVIVHWGEVGAAQAILKLMQTVVDSGRTFKYFTVLSGSDYPIKDRQAIYARLQASNGQRMRIDRILTHDPNDPFRQFLQRLPRGTYYDDLTPYHGSMFWSLTADCVRFILDFVTQHPGFVDLHRHIFAPEEVLFPTIVKYSPFAETIMHDFEKRTRPKDNHHANHYIDWVRARKPNRLTLDEGDFDDLMQSAALFARKFHEQQSSKLLDLLDEQVHYRI